MSAAEGWRPWGDEGGLPEGPANARMEAVAGASQPDEGQILLEGAAEELVVVRTGDTIIGKARGGCGQELIWDMSVAAALLEMYNRCWNAPTRLRCGGSDRQWRFPRPGFRARRQLSEG